MINFKSKKGITIVSLVLAVIIVSILSTVAIYTYNSTDNVAPYNKMIADIDLLESKLLIYYNKYEEIPVTNIEETINNTTYYEIDLTKLENLTLNLGSKSEEGDYYLVNNNLEVYYKLGTQKKNVTYHTK